MFPHAGSRTSKPGLLCATLALALVLLLVADAAEGAEVSSADRVRRYWTPQRMESARPLDLVVGRDDEPHLRLGRPAPPLASASFAAVTTPTVPPYSVNGRVFIRIGNDRGYCSGTAIDSPTRQLVLTAGHCVNAGARYHGNLWYRNLLFVPAYTAGRAPLGAFPARPKKVFSPPQWRHHNNYDFDVGAFLAAPNNRGIDVADAVGGGAAIALDLTRNQEFATFGYPANRDRMQTCNAFWASNDRFTNSLPGPPTLGIDCNWAPGASGGGWLIEDGTRLNGLTSYSDPSHFYKTYGPYFSRETVGKLVAGL
jgi:V8-like Glu-specific endopeptidase